MTEVNYQCRIFCLPVCYQNWQHVNWINLAEARERGVVVLKPRMNLDCIKCEEFLEFSQGTGVFSRTVHNRVSFFFFY
jgi:hypothetical protein